MSVQCQLNHVYIAPQGQPAIAPLGVTSTSNRSLHQVLLPRFTEAGMNRSSIPQYRGLPWRAEVDFLNDDAQSSRIADNHVAINQTGVYIMWFVTCDAELAEVRAPLYLSQSHVHCSACTSNASELQLIGKQFLFCCISCAPAHLKQAWYADTCFWRVSLEESKRVPARLASTYSPLPCIHRTAICAYRADVAVPALYAPQPCLASAAASHSHSDAGHARVVHRLLRHFPPECNRTAQLRTTRRGYRDVSCV